MTSVVLDTNSFLRVLLNDIPKQAEEVEKLIQKARLGKVEIIVPQIVIFEIAFTLDKFYNLPKDEIVQKLDFIISSQDFAIQNQDVFYEALKLFEYEKIHFVDCFLIYYAKLLNRKLFSFDKSLKKLWDRLEAN